MLLSVNMPHSGRDEVDHVEALESVRATLTEGKRAGAVGFFIGGDLNIEPRPDIADFERQGLDGPSAKEAVRIPSLIGKLKLLQLLGDFNCNVTSIWTNNEDNREFHTKGVRSATWYLNRVRLRTWDFFPVFTKIEGRELKTKRRIKGWAGLDARFRSREG